METKTVTVNWTNPIASIEIEVPINMSEREIEKLASKKFIDEFMNSSKLSWIDNF